MRPKSDGFRMPAEFCPHQQTLMLIPFRADVWRKNARPAQDAFIGVARAIAQFEPVSIGVDPRIFDDIVGRYQGDHKQSTAFPIQFFPIDSDDCWMRDVGPTFITNGTELRGIDWKFNAWGGKYDGLYESWEKDDQVAQKIICDRFRLQRYRTDDFVMEGGALHVDGNGLVMVTEACLLSRGRNPNMTKQDIEQHLKESLGAEKVLWIPRGIYEDETNEHVDNIACFVGPGHVLIATTENNADPQYALSRSSLAVLEGETDVDGNPLRISTICLPDPPLYMSEEEANGLSNGESISRSAGRRLAASYVNFYFTNGGIVMPCFGLETDKEAYRKLQDLFPERKVVGVYSREILLGGGNIHCITQQVPKI